MSEEYTNDSPVWKIEGEQEWRKGNSQIRLSPKSYRIVFRDIEGYRTPKPQVVYIVANQTVQVNANYVYVGDEQASSSQEQQNQNEASSGSDESQSEEESSDSEWQNPNENILHFVAEKKDSMIKISYNNSTIGSNSGVSQIYYSTNNCETWENYSVGNTIQLRNIGDTVYFKSERFSFKNSNYCYFQMSGKIASYGNVMSLAGGIDNPSVQCSNYVFFSLFKDCTALTRAPELPATILAPSCYEAMFEGCTSLEEPPVLPATELANYCYFSMFKGCTSLKYAPVLPATVMKDSCYQYMFSGCTSIATPPTLPSMTLENYCYSRMFENCTSLTEMPELPTATMIKEGCYDTMFSGCTSLTSIKSLPCEDLHTKAYYKMFLGCTGITEAVLPFTSLSLSSCMEMFNGCTSLEKITVNFTEWLNDDNATKDWLKNVAPEGEFIAPESLTEIRGNSNIPSGWTLTRKQG